MDTPMLKNNNKIELDVKRHNTAALRIVKVDSKFVPQLLYLIFS